MDTIRRLHEDFLAAVRKQMQGGPGGLVSEVVEMLRASATELELQVAEPQQHATSMEASFAAMDAKLHKLSTTISSLSDGSVGPPTASLVPEDIPPSSIPKSTQQGPPPSPDFGLGSMPPSGRARVRSLSKTDGQFLLRNPHRVSPRDSYEKLSAADEMNPTLYVSTPRDPASRNSSASLLGSLTANHLAESEGATPVPPAERRIAELEGMLFRSRDEVKELQRQFSLSSPTASTPTSSLALVVEVPEPESPREQEQTRRGRRASPPPVPADAAQPQPVALRRSDSSQLGSPRMRREMPDSAAETSANVGRVTRRGSTLGFSNTAISANPQHGMSATSTRRMSLSSMLRNQGEEKVGKVEEMVTLLTSISSARDCGTLVSMVVHGIIQLGSPDCSSVHFWVCALDKTFSATISGDVREQEGMYSPFMQALYSDPDKQKVNVPVADFKVLPSTKLKRSTSSMNKPWNGPEGARVLTESDQLYAEEEDEDEDDDNQSVLVLGAFDSQRNMLGMVELRNSPMMAILPKNFTEDEVETYMPVVAQAGVTLSNVLYNDRTSAALQQYDFNPSDMATLTQEIVASGHDLFEAAAVILVMKRGDDLVGTFNDGRVVKMPAQGTTASVWSTQLRMWVDDITEHTEVGAIEAEFAITGRHYKNVQTMSLVLNPVIVGGETLGVIVILGSDANPTDDEQRIVTFCGQIGILLNNAMLYQKAKQEREKIRQRLELLDVAKSIASEVKTDKMSAVIVEKTRTVLNADRGYLFIRESHSKVLLAHMEGGQTIECATDSGMAGWVVANKSILRMDDAYADPRFDDTIDRETNYHTHSLLAVPLNDETGNLVGLLMMLNKRGGKFTGDDEDVCKIISEQAGVNIGNALKFDQAMKYQDDFNELLDISKQLSSELDTNVLIKNIMGSARRLLDCERCSLFMLDHERNQLWAKVSTGINGGATIRMPADKGIVGSSATQNVVVNIPDAYQDDRFDRSMDKKTGYHTKSILCVPIQDSHGRVLGVTQMLNKKPADVGIFDEADVNLMKAFGAQAAVSLENSKLFEDAVESGNFLSSVLRSIKHHVYAFDKEGYLLQVNHSTETYFGITEDEISGTVGDRGGLKYTQWLGDQPLLLADIAQAMRNREDVVGGQMEVTNGDTQFNLIYHISPLIFAQKKKTERLDLLHQPSPKAGERTLRGFVLILEDISEKRMMKETLGRYLNEKLVHEVLKSGVDSLGGVRQKVTVLFSDIRDFTSISEAMDAADLVTMLNEYFGTQISPILDNNGVLDKFIGDAIMATFGVPFAHGTDTRRACTTALQMVQQLAKFNAKAKASGKRELAIGLGLNTGKVISGNIGSEKRMEYTVIGDPVNLASRLEGITKTYGVQICISEFTHQEISPFFVTRELDCVAVKGKENGIRIFELLREREEATPYSDDDDGSAVVEQVSDARWLSVTNERAICDQACIDEFESALEMYRKQRFAEAIKVFELVNEMTAVDGGDAPSRLFIQRCNEFIDSPPEQGETGWDGVYRPKSK